MMISKLTMAASLVLFAGMAAWGAVELAGKTPAGSAPSPPPEAHAVRPQLALAPVVALADSSADANTHHEDGKSQSDPVIPDELPPVVIDIEPKVGAKDVDPGLREIRVTFSKKMTDKSWSWTQGNVYSFPKRAGEVHYEADKRTCVMPVKLEPGKTYVLGINSERFHNFKDLEGHPALPYLLVFHTKAAR